MDVVIYQVGPFPGLRHCLESIQLHSPGSRVHVLGDEIPWFAPIPIKPYSTFANKFASVYEHWSVNPLEFELRCFQRWMVILEYVRSIGLKEFFTCDSDVLIFGDLAKDAEQFRGCQCTLPLGSSFIFDVRALELFVRYCFWYYTHKNNSYRESNERHFQNSKLQSISDMTLIDRFSWSIHTKVATDPNLPVQVDPNIALIHNHFSTDGLKRIYFIRGSPFGINNTGNLVRFICLHCWGKAKERMAWYLEESRKSL